MLFNCVVRRCPGTLAPYQHHVQDGTGAKASSMVCSANNKHRVFVVEGKEPSPLLRLYVTRWDKGVKALP